eukprot:5696854-Pyramimonas_sp.AAC.1
MTRSISGLLVGGRGVERRARWKEGRRGEGGRGGHGAERTRTMLPTSAVPGTSRQPSPWCPKHCCDRDQPEGAHAIQ